MCVCDVFVCACMRIYIYVNHFTVRIANMEEFGLN